MVREFDSPKPATPKSVWSPNAAAKVFEPSWSGNWETLDTSVAAELEAAAWVVPDSKHGAEGHEGLPGEPAVWEVDCFGPDAVAGWDADLSGLVYQPEPFSNGFDLGLAVPLDFGYQEQGSLLGSSSLNREASEFVPEALGALRSGLQQAGGLAAPTHSPPSFSPCVTLAGDNNARAAILTMVGAWNALGKLPPGALSRKSLLNVHHLVREEDPEVPTELQSLTCIDQEAL
eukprot:TRINITY_DN32080_c0_g1_i1.p1 TRINITY_DN32080_c0_g1~~TRINITY_DN32080_c0_g1_i1.p1  ORF type:complete len:231 (+),score=35.06 TRINITY_DN32080_c0_g1_i1:41-733(+)